MARRIHESTSEFQREIAAAAYAAGPRSGLSDIRIVQASGRRAACAVHGAAVLPDSRRRNDPRPGVRADAGNIHAPRKFSAEIDCAADGEKSLADRHGLGILATGFAEHLQTTARKSRGHV